MAAMKFAHSNVPSRSDEAAPMEAVHKAALREAFSQTVDRIEHLVDQETALLRQYRPIDFAEFNHRKSHALLELTRALRALGVESRDAGVCQALERLGDKLRQNLATLEIHLKAVRQVCALISAAIETEESDGTYSLSVYRGYQQS